MSCDKRCFDEDWKYGDIDCIDCPYQDSPISEAGREKLLKKLKKGSRKDDIFDEAIEMTTEKMEIGKLSQAVIKLNEQLSAERERSAKLLATLQTVESGKERG